MDELKPILQSLLDGRRLTEHECEHAFECILEGRAAEAQIGAMLALIAARGPTVDELVGAARAMRRRATPVPRPADGPFAGARLLDTCGTGGAPKLFNVSTIAALIVPAAGRGRVAVCKHGNVSRTGRGSAELLRELGVNIEASPAAQQRCLGEVGVCFSLATAHHPAARHAAGPRRALGFPTLFNLLGPLANPAGAERQLMGTWSHENARLLAAALARLGDGRSLVTCSRDGLDELTTTDANHAHEVVDGSVHELLIDASELGFARPSAADLRAESLADAVRIAREVLDGKPGPCTDMALLNAGAAVWIADAAPTLAEGVNLARQALASGEAARTLEGLRTLSWS